MAYRNDATERARLHRLWITEQDLPCAMCGSRVKREVAHKDPYSNGGSTTENNCRVLCRVCNLAEYPFAKFLLGDKVRLRNDSDRKHGIPDRLDFTDYEKSRPRTIVAIRYDRAKQANLYKLIPYEPRRYHFKRQYHRSKLSNPSNPNPEFVNTKILSDASKMACRQSQEIIGK